MQNLTEGILLKKGHVEEACHFAFEFKRKYEQKLELLEKDFNDSFDSSFVGQMGSPDKLNRPNQQRSLSNMIPITEVDNDGMLKRTSRLDHSTKKFEDQLISRNFSSEDIPEQMPESSSDGVRVVDQLLALECAFSVEEQFNLLKEKIMFFYSFTEKFILNALSSTK